MQSISIKVNIWIRYFSDILHKDKASKTTLEEKNSERKNEIFRQVALRVGVFDNIEIVGLLPVRPEYDVKRLTEYNSLCFG